MLIKSKNTSLKTITLILIVLILSFFTLNTEKFKTEKMDIIQYLMSMNLGFSNRVNLVDAGEGIFHNENPNGFIKYKQTILPSIINAVPKIIKYKVTGDNFKRIDIDIKYLDLQKIILDKEKAIKVGLLSNPTTINVKVRFKGNTYKAKLRLKGDLSGHWSSKYRNSFRVSLKNKATILGFNKFSIQKPGERQHPYDYVFQSLMRDTGNIASVHKFAHIFVNGEDWGIMDIEEHMSKELLEKQGRKESIIIRFSNEDKWQQSESYDAYRISDPYLYIRLYGSKRYLKNYHFRKMYSYITKQHQNYKSSLYDTDSFAKAYILSVMWNDLHTLKNFNSRYYFNPYTLKLETITTDAGSFSSLNNLEDIRFYPVESHYFNVLSSQAYADNLPKNLSNVVNVVSKNIKQHFNSTSLLFPVDRKKSTKVINNNIQKILNKKKYYLITPPKKQKSIDYKKLILPTKQQASGFKEHLHIRHYTDGTLKLHNLLPDNVTVKDILFNGKSIAINNTIVPSYLSHPEPTIIKTPYKGIQDDMFTINTEYQGFNRAIKNDITLVSDGIVNPLLLDTANEFDFINKLGGNAYEIKQGNWIVNKPIIVNGDLHISPGVNLQFSKNAYIIVKGSLTAIGNEENPITLKAISDSWKGIYVLNADKKSHLKNVNISNLSALEDELLKLTGGVTFYKSDVDFYNVRINDIEAEDALNIVESKFSLNSVYINSAVSDGLDSDFSKGSISNSEFSDIGGDALDFSGSNVSIVKTEANNIKDKAVSAGEKSTLTIKDSTFNNIGVGIASKDGSSVTATDTKILNYKLYGAMTYLKKDFYDMPSLVINNVSVSDGHAYIRQKGTSMTVDGIDVPDTKISVKKLYKTKVMTK